MKYLIILGTSCNNGTQNALASFLVVGENTKSLPGICRSCVTTMFSARAGSYSCSILLGCFTSTSITLVSFFSPSSRLVCVSSAPGSPSHPSPLLGQLGHLHVLMRPALASPSSLHIDRSITLRIPDRVYVGDRSTLGRLFRVIAPTRLSLVLPTVLCVSSEERIVGYVLVVLHLVHSNDLGFVVCSEVQAGNEVDDEHDGVGDDKGPGGSNGDPCDLFTELNPVSVHPSTGNGGVSVVGSDRGLSEAVVEGQRGSAFEITFTSVAPCNSHSGHESTNGTGQSVDRENIHRIVDPHRDLESGGQVGTSASNESDEGGGGSTNETGSGGDGDESVRQGGLLSLVRVR